MNKESIANPPKVEIISESTRVESGLFKTIDDVFFIDVSVHNKGGNGIVTVWAKLIQAGHHRSKKQEIYLNKDESRDLSFSFKRVAEGIMVRAISDIGHYQVWVENK